MSGCADIMRAAGSGATPEMDRGHRKSSLPIAIKLSQFSHTLRVDTLDLGFIYLCRQLIFTYNLDI